MVLTRVFFPKVMRVSRDKNAKSQFEDQRIKRPLGSFIKSVFGVHMLTTLTRRFGYKTKTHTQKNDLELWFWHSHAASFTLDRFFVVYVYVSASIVLTEQTKGKHKLWYAKLFSSRATK
ncbi:hypothetical protein BCR39DRAFT_65853 [Naematelia encephala]|uniref:Uncharacterized protein n=1 Tax=Naematelia encephala TaxID=71784 RepID=A0A1Y2AF83_9TREE|nr:hypothetical protein BCR39DRAFT_65853 [Naematelia encephala]